MKTRAFTLIELLVVAAVVIVLAAVALPAVQSARTTSWKAVSTHTLRQLITAGHTYIAEHDGKLWPYIHVTGEGTNWWYGFETNASRWSTPDGKRFVDLSRGLLGPYLTAAGGWKTDPAFLAAGNRHKPKYNNGNFGFAFNVHLGGGWSGTTDPPNPRSNSNPILLASIQRPSQILAFVTSAQVNIFQRPASPSNPMIEEFYGIDNGTLGAGANNRVVHFRHGEKALAAFLDGAVRLLEMEPGTRDMRMPRAKIGAVAPKGSPRYLVEID